MTRAFAVADVFLAEHLGGRKESLSGEDFRGASIQVLTGGDQVEGL